MKKITKLFILLILLLSINANNDVFATLTGTNDLISVGTGSNKFVVTKTTTIEQIKAKLGAPKIETDSAFGGKAYTFYTDDNYSNYLYIETTNENKIISYGSVDPTYETTKYSFGDEYPYNENDGLYGCLYSYDGEIRGGIYYNKSALYSGRYSQIITFFKESYLANQTKYLKSMSEHGVAMYNAVSTFFGNKSYLEFNEDFFYINEQFKELGTSIRVYMRDMNKYDRYVKSIGLRENIDIANSIYYVLNPLLFASMASTNVGSNYGDKLQAVFDYDYENRILCALALSPDAFESVEEVELTAEEKSKLSAGRYEYEQAEINFKKDSEIYDIIPVANSASGLVAGKLKASKAQAITDYVNAIRVAGGLPKLNLNEEAFSVAQHISTLMTYRYDKLGENIQHQPPKPAGVSDAYYNLAIGYGLGYSENLGYSATETSVNTMKYYINLFLDDSSENPQFFSHRQKLLNAEFTEFGYGISPQMFANEFKGYKATNNYLEAWPSNGITFMETLHNTRFQWTAQFTDKYTILNNTTARIKCLNTGDVWNFEKEEKTNSRWFARHTDSISSLNNKVVMYDSSIIPAAGYVYEITLYNVKDENNNITNYTYRSAFEYADLDNYPSTLSEINIQVPSTIVKVADENVYYIPVGEEVKLSVAIDENVTDKKISWISSDPNVTVTQNGIVFANSTIDGDVTITVSYDGSSITDEVVFRPYTKLEQVRLDKKEVECIALGEDNQDEISEILYVEYVPDDASEVTTVEWKIISNTNTNIEYDIDDPAITEYIRLEKDPNDPRRAYIHAITAETSNNIYTIIAKVRGLSGEYTGTCKVTIKVPLNSIRILPATVGTSITGKVLNINCDTYPNDYFDLKTNFSPSNMTESKLITWVVADTSVVSDYNQTGSFKILKEGSTTIKAVSSNPSITDMITVNVNVTLNNIEIKGTKNTFNILYNTSPKTTDQLKLTRDPVTDNDLISYKSSDNSIATVDANGLVTFTGLKSGSVTITAQSTEKTSIKDTYTYDVKFLVENMKFPSTATKELVKGQTYTQTAAVTPNVSDYKNKVTYTSSNSQVATVSSTGLVRAVGGGTAVITATIPGTYTKTGQTITSSYTVEVSVPLEDVEVETSKTMTINSNYRFAVVPIPEDTTDNYLVQWTSANSSIVSVDPDTGMATAHAVGETVLYVSIFNVDRNETIEREVEVSVINYLKGDLDRNSLVDSADAAIALNLYKYNNATSVDIEIGDMDENGMIDSADAAMILNVYKYGN